ncbi:MAG TPA: hypothetical protein VHP33_38420 [Polyangiaceae bacterium]|nr:hypothetical protein [Polyangiaceae bacterium]
MATQRGLLQGAGLAVALGLALPGCAGPRAPTVELGELSGRSVATPQRLGWVSSEQPSGALPSAIALGGKASGRVLVYFEFAAPSETRRLHGAALLLSTSGAPGQSIEVELSRAEPPSAELRSWADQPRARYPRLTARLPGNTESVRLDVTELVRAEAKPGEPLRLLLRAEPGTAEPVLVATGAAGGAAPRLEAYWE